MDDLYIVMPAYNEEANIESVVEEWYPHIADKGAGSKFVIADSGSTDSTHAILLKLQKKYPRLEILSETGKQHGPKLMALYQHVVCAWGGGKTIYFRRILMDRPTLWNLKHFGS